MPRRTLAGRLLLVTDDETKHFRANLMTEAEFQAKRRVRHYETGVTTSRSKLKQTWCSQYVTADEATALRHLVTCPDCRRLARIEV